MCTCRDSASRLILYMLFNFLLDNETTAFIAFGYQSSEFQSTCDSLKHTRLQRPVEFLINLYREHGTKKPFCDSIFDLKEQLIALQLVMAQLNKEVQKVFHTSSTLKNSAWAVLFSSQRFKMIDWRRIEMFPKERKLH